MKKFRKIIVVSFAMLTMVACEDLTEFNQDKKNPESVPAGALFANSTKSLVDFMTETNVNVNNFRLWAQQWAQTTYADESNYDLITRNVNGAAWNTLYRVVRDLTDAKAFIAESNIPSDEKEKQTAMCDVLQVFSYHVLVDIFGNVPYTEALTEDVTPAYDDDLAIYNDLVARLDADIAVLSGDSGMGAADLVYGGDADMWRRFANSLKLRLALRFVQVDATKAGNMVTQALTSGVFTSNADNFTLFYESETPNTNPLWVSLIQSGRSDFIAASTLVDRMNALNDPRLPFYYKDPVGLAFKGGSYGDNNAFNAFSHPGLYQEDPTFPGILLSYWEVEFILADFAARGLAGLAGTEATHYNNAIAASITYWTDDPTDATAYLAQPSVAFATATGTPLQRIAMQKWIALYDQGFEAWSTYRIYNYPVLPIAVLSELPTPSRYTYPVTEYSLNEVNAAAAGSAMGGDTQQTKVFWDVN